MYPEYIKDFYNLRRHETTWQKVGIMLTSKGLEKHFRVMDMFYITVMEMATKVYALDKSNQNLNLKWLNIIICIL